MLVLPDLMGTPSSLGRGMVRAMPIRTRVTLLEMSMSLMWMKDSVW